MPAPMSALAFAGNTAKPGAPAMDAAPRDGSAGAKEKPDFETLVRRDKAEASTRGEKPGVPREDRRAASGMTDATPVEQAPRTTARRAAKPHEDPAAPLPAAPWPVETAIVATPLAAIAIAAENPLLGDAASTLLPTADPAGVAFAADAIPGRTPATPLTGTEAGTVAPALLALDMPPPLATPAADATLPTDAAVPTETTAATPLPAATTEGAKPALQNLLSFAAHLASGNIAAAVPEALSLGKDVVDALRSEDADSTSPTGNTLAGLGSATSPLGLPRTATVNPMEAPSADLHGGRFDEEIGDSVRWMADQKIGHAHIKITPNEMGTVEVRLRLDGDRVHADFTSAQADVRQALENSLPKLRDMLGQHGFQLAHADVGQQHQSPPQHADGRHGDGEAGGPALTGEAELPRPVRMTVLGLLDAYA
jgi:flagellar hook-length control protein FliK